MKSLRASCIILFFFLLMTINLQSQQRYIDSNDYTYTGKVKSMSYMFYEAIEKNQKIVKGNRKIEDVFDYDSRVSFDTLGRRTEILYFRSDDIPVYKEKYEYNGLICNKSIYDIKGNLLESDILIKNKHLKDVEIENNVSVDSLKQKYIYKYDDKDNLSKWEIYNSDDSLMSRRLYIYNEKNKLTEMKFENPDGTTRISETRVYSDNEKKIENRRFNENGELMNIVWYLYDDSGRKIEEKWGTSDGKIVDNSVMKYNENGNQVQMLFYTSEGKIHQKDIYQYKYDSMGNWTEKIIFRNDKALSIIEREINYY